MPAPIPARLLAAAVGSIAVCGVAASQSSPDPFAALDVVVQGELTRTGAPGAAVVIVDGERVVLAKAYGLANIETKTPVTADTLFQIGSVTKSFTAAALLSAAADGVIAPDAEVGSIVSGLTPCLGKATISQLLSHSGGLIDEPDEFGPQGEEGLAAYPRTWTTEYCLLPPGRTFSYSNSGYALAGLALQEREKKPFADVMRARVLEPLGMASTTFRPTEAMTWPLAVGHRRAKGLVRVVRPLPNDARLWPAGTLYSSAHEMGRFLIALVNEGRVGSQQALRSQTVQAMLTSRISAPSIDADYGYGLQLDRFRNQRRAGHAGGMTGYGAAMAVLPDRKIGVAVLANGDGAILPIVVERALEMTLNDRATPQPPPGATQDFALPPSRLDGYVGKYTNPRRFTVEVMRQGDALVLRRFGRDFSMRPVAADRFTVERPGGGQETIAFGLDGNGRSEYLQLTVWALARIR